MFSITYEDETYRQWKSDFLFESYKEAERYLSEEDFIKISRLFYRENYNWSLYLKAYITPMKIYKKSRSH